MSNPENKEVVPAKKKFTYQFDVEVAPYNPESAKYLYGGGYNPDFPEDVWARELASELIQDALAQVLMLKLKFLSQKKTDVKDFNEFDKAYWEHLGRKEERYKKIQETLKLASEPKVTA